MSFSIYIHIPFCSRRCDYCDFATWTDKSDDVEEYVEAVIAQARYHGEEYGREHPGEAVQSIFFGGGTPNFVDAAHLSKIIETVSGLFSRSDDCEVTVESNPDHVTSQQMEVYASAGVNRISLGIQSTNSEVLAYLGREHTPEHVPRAIDAITHAGITNINGDLIYGSACESREQWRQSLCDVIDMGVTHVSAYALGIEKATPLARSVLLGDKRATNDDDLADKYMDAETVLSENGFEWYEISNWAKPGFHSRHNTAYWHGHDVIALGCAAHGYTRDKRWATPRNIDVYLDKFSPRRVSTITSDAFVSHDLVSSISREEELFSLALRTREGIQWPAVPNEDVTQLIDGGFIVYNHGAISLSVQGRLMAHPVSIALFEQYTSLQGL